jgi:hypothetical protein
LLLETFTFGVLIGHILDQSSSEPRADNIACVGVDFSDPKGGAWSVGMEVYPVFNGKGRVVAGEDAGSTIKSLVIEPYDYPQLGLGYFTYNWEAHTGNILNSTVNVSTSIDGVKFTCPSENLTFDTRNLIPKPGLPNDPNVPIVEPGPQTKFTPTTIV